MFRADKLLTLSANGENFGARRRVYVVRIVSLVPKLTLRGQVTLLFNTEHSKSAPGIHWFSTHCFDQFLLKSRAARPCCRQLSKKSEKSPWRKPAYFSRIRREDDLRAGIFPGSCFLEGAPCSNTHDR